MIQDFVFRVRVNARECVVKHKNSRVANEGAGDCRALLLSPRQSDPALADYCFVTLGEGLNIRGDVGGLSGVVNLFVGRKVDSERDVFAYAIAEQECLLRDKADIAPE